ncbi:MAG: CRISPR-associated endonuclease Cas1 [Rhodocyclaceae bacterium]
MATLFIDRAGTDLRMDGGALAIYQDGERQRTVPLALLGRAVLRGDVRLSARVLTVAAEAGVSLLFLSARASRRVAIVLGPPHNDARIRLAQFAAALDPAFKLATVRALVRAKLRRQSRHLREALLHRPDLRKPLVDAAASIERCIDSAADAPDAAVLRGLEGAGSAAYFPGLASLFAPELGFRGRNRRPPRDPVNAALSLAYTLLHHEAVAAAYGCGLDPYVGFLHEPSFGRESLACDLVEPLRPAADAWVREMFRGRSLRAEDFRDDKGACLMGKAGRARFYENWQGFARGERKRLRRYCAQLVRALPGAAARENGTPAFEAAEEEAF